MRAGLLTALLTAGTTLSESWSFLSSVSTTSVESATGAQPAPDAVACGFVPDEPAEPHAAVRPVMMRRPAAAAMGRASLRMWIAPRLPCPGATPVVGRVSDGRPGAGGQCCRYGCRHIPPDADQPTSRFGVRQLELRKCHRSVTSGRPYRDSTICPTRTSSGGGLDGGGAPAAYGPQRLGRHGPHPDPEQPVDQEREHGHEEGAGEHLTPAAGDADAEPGV